MFYRIFALVFISLIVVALSGSSQSNRPDLLPVPDPRPGYNFCRRDNSGKLIVTVKNQNNNDVGAHTSITKVEFYRGGIFELPTPAIPAGSSVNLQPLDIPAECWGPDCSFTITVDSNNQVHESIENNNSGSCTLVG